MYDNLHFWLAEENNICFTVFWVRLSVYASCLKKLHYFEKLLTFWWSLQAVYVLVGFFFCSFCSCGSSYNTDTARDQERWQICSQCQWTEEKNIPDLGGIDLWKEFKRLGAGKNNIGYNYRWVKQPNQSSAKVFS